MRRPVVWRFVPGLLLLPLFAGSAVAVTVERRGNTLRIASPVGVAEVRLDRYRLTVRGPGRRRLVGEARSPGAYFERAGADAPVTLGAVTRHTPTANGAVLDVLTSDGGTAQVELAWRTTRTVECTIVPPDPATLVAIGDRFRSPRDEAIYGLTERMRDSPPIADGVIDIPQDDVRPVEVGSLDRRGEAVEMYVRPTFALYAPFFQSSRGYGLAVDGTMVGAFDVAKTDPKVVAMRFETSGTPASRRLRFRVFIGPDHATILDEYTGVTGRPIVPPAWAFGHWRWRDELPVGVTGTVDGATVHGYVAQDLAQYEALGLPAGVWIFDRPSLEGEYGFARLAWDATRLPNQAALLGSMRRRGWRIVSWSSLWTCGSGPEDLGTAAQAGGYHVPGPVAPPHCADIGGTSFVLDPTVPGAGDWWASQLGTFLAEQGLDGVKLDRGEEHIPSRAIDVWGDGRTGREARNAYPTLQAKIHHDALAAARPDGDFVLIARAGYTGTARWAIAWGGDIAGSETFGSGPGTDLGLRSAIISQQRAAFMGYPIWGSDTGGYYQFKDREVFARWIEFSAFSGIMEIGGKGSHAPWDMPTDPQVDAEMIAIYSRYVRARHALQPYIVQAAAAAAMGMPLVRPMAFVEPRSRKLRNRWDQYLFGPDLLVAPVWKVGQRARQVIFPSGRWRNLWNPSETVDGPRTLTVDVPLDAIPVWVRDGAAVPPPPS